MRQMK